MRLQELAHTVNQIGLQTIYVVDTQFLHQSLTARTLWPRCLAGLITAYMDIGGGKHFHHFGQHIFQKSIGCFVAGTEVGLFVRFVRTRKFGIGCEHFFRMGRHLNFGHKGDASLLCIVVECAQFILGVISPVGPGCTFSSIVSLAVVPPGFP